MSSRRTRLPSFGCPFGCRAEYDEKLRRIRDLYNRRLYSNISSYLRQIFQEIGAKNIDERTRAGSFMLTAMMHGVWISYVTHEEWSDDISHGRLLVWECLEMLLSRSREILNPEEPTATIATSTTLLSDVSMEVIAADVGKIDQWIEYAPAGMTIYLPHFRGSTPLSDRIRMAGRLLDHGLCPVPHIAARNLRDKEELEQTIAGFTALGLKEFLLLGGGEPQPVGEFDAVIPVLQSGVFAASSGREGRIRRPSRGSSGGFPRCPAARLDREDCGGEGVADGLLCGDAVLFRGASVF